MDWDKLAAEVAGAEEDHKKADNRWYQRLEGTIAYEKLKSLQDSHLKAMVITESSKRWWDEELTEQLKTTRKARREKLGDGMTQRERRIRWQAEKEKMRTLVREKKKECWQKFCKEHGKKDPWEIVKWAKDPWHLTGTMKKLVDVEGVELETDGEKVTRLVKDHFSWREDGRGVEEAEREEEKRGPTDRQGQLEEEVRKALSGTSNSSAPGPDGIGYRLIKMVLGRKLGDELMKEVARNLAKGKIPKEWQNSKVIMIPKPGKDYNKTKEWRPINLINCIGKLGEKVIANRLQESGLLYKHQFGSIKERSVTEVALRVVTKAQRCMARGGAVGWGLWDVKERFQNVREEDVIRELKKSEEGRKWIPWCRKFFRAREVEMEWNRRVRGRGRTNVGAPQGSPVSPVLFLIRIAPIITKMETALEGKFAGKRAEIEMPS